MCMASRKVLILEFWFLVDRVSSGAIALRDVASLDDKPIYNPVNFAAKVVQFAPLLAFCGCTYVLGVTVAVLASAETSKVFSCEGCDIVVELKHDTTCLLGSNGELHEHSGMFRHSF